MGKGYIVRRGGGGQQTVKPIFNSVVSSTFTSITVNIENDDNSEAILYYSVVNADPQPDQANTFEVTLDGRTAGNATITGLTQGTSYTLYIKALSIGKFPSDILTVAGQLQTGLPIVATGGTITNYSSGGTNYRVHTFTGNGTFAVTSVPNITGFNEADYLIVAGGGGGGGRHGGGGGAGGYIVGTRPLTATSYGITVGGGGGGREGNGGNGGMGGPSSFFSQTANGGGGGGTYGDSGSTNGLAGGSGGGGSYNMSGGASNQPAVSPGTAFGFAGAAHGSEVTGGGGGGAGAVGQTGGSSGGPGGAGRQSNIDGNNYYYAGGGGGSSWNGGAGGNGGIGGGGGGQTSPAGGASSIQGVGGGSARNPGGPAVATANNNVQRFAGSGGANTGGGGGAADQSGYLSYRGVGGNGGSGIVIIRYVVGGNV